MRAEIECSELHFTTISPQFLLNCSKTYVLADWLLLMLLKYLKKVQKSRLSNWPLFPRLFPRYLEPFAVFLRVLHHLWLFADFAATIHHYKVVEDSFCEEKCSKRMANRSQTKRSISAHTPTVWHFACVQIVAIYLMIALHRAAPTVLAQHPASPSAGEGRGPHFLLHCPPPVSCGTSPGQWPRGRLHPAVEGWPLRSALSPDSSLQEGWYMTRKQ